jgi:uncharacterized alkaline shock family protein YloU
MGAGGKGLERTTGLGRLVLPDEVVAAVAARCAIATAAIAGLVRPGAAPGAPLLPVRHLARGVRVGERDGRLHVVVYAAARFGVRAEDLRRAAERVADSVAASIGGDAVVEAEIRVRSVRTRARLVRGRAFRAEARPDGGGEWV